MVQPDSAMLVRKLWQYCAILRDDGLSYPDYVEQLTYLLFLKISDEQEEGPVPPEYSWRVLAALDSEAMRAQYVRTLAALGERPGMLGVIFRNARNKIKDPAKLRRLVVELIGQTAWHSIASDLKGDAYEGLLEKNARDTKSGAGQYFTPRPLIDAIVRCVDPKIGESVCDPACGTGGFLLAVQRHLSNGSASNGSPRSGDGASDFHGVELVEEVARLAAMNLMLHGITSESDKGLPIVCADSLREPPTRTFDVVLTNPPFGVKGSVTYSGSDRKAIKAGEELELIRPDFWAATANKQLNFIQHVVALLKPGGRAAVVVPDNVLYESGAGAAIRRRLLEKLDLHTMLRLPPGLFYAQGVMANVLFFERRLRARKARRLRVYDLRTGSRFSLKARPLRSEDLTEFVEGYCEFARGGRDSERPTESTRWRAFEVEALLATDTCDLDLTWRSESEPAHSRLSRLDELSELILADLQQAVSHINRARSGPS